MKNIHIEGFEAIAKKLSEMPSKLEKQVLRQALHAGAKVYADDMRANVAVQHGDLKKSIRVSSKTSSKGVEANAVVGGKKIRYAHLVEFGTNAHAINAQKAPNLSFMIGGRWIKTKQVMHTGARAKPFIRPAYDNKSAQVVNEIAGKIRAKVEELAK